MWRRPIYFEYTMPNGTSSDAFSAYRTSIGSSEDKYISPNHEDSGLEPGARVLKYKKVEDRIRPVPAVMPEDVKVRRVFPEDPLMNLPVLPTHPPEFSPTPKVTQERMDKLGIDDNKDLTDEEKRLLKHVLVINQRSIAFTEDERGTFRGDYFSDYQIPVTSHVPWMDKNIPLPPGHRDKIIEMLREKMGAGVYEKAQSSYRSRWFCVQKKNGELRMVHDLQKLNGVTIRDSGVPPILDEFVEAYAGRSVYSVLDMYWGFYARTLDPRSRDMTAFQTPLGVLRITSLPMGFTNSPSEFQACMVFILQDEIPHVADVFIDDIPIKGPVGCYVNPDGKEEHIPENPEIRRFMWEHLNDLHRVLHRIGEAGGTVSGKKMQLCKTEVEIVGQKCSREGREPTDVRTQRIKDWPTPVNLTEVRGFLGLCGTVRIWIRNYSQIARALVDLTRKDAPFEWGEEQEEAFQKLKELVSTAPALKPIDYKCGRPVILSVDTSIYGIGFVLSQLDEGGRKVPARYGSLPMPEVAARSYGQSKLELYGLFRALKHFGLYLVGAPKLIVEVDASCIKGMLNNPDAKLSSPMNRWIQGILEQPFKLVHVPGKSHTAPDALSRRRYTEADGAQELDMMDSSDKESVYLPEDDLDEAAHASLDNFLDGETLVPKDEFVKGRRITFQDDNLDEETLAPEDEFANRRRIFFQDGGSEGEASNPQDGFPRPRRQATPAGTITRRDKDQELFDIMRFLKTFHPPVASTARERQRFLGQAARHYCQGNRLYRRHASGNDQRVLMTEDERKKVLQELHDGFGHRGEWAVWEAIRIRFYWPGMRKDITKYVQSCHICQLRSTKKVHIPVNVSQPVALFSKVYLDVMKMPEAQGKNWIVACRDDVSGVTEGRALASDNSRALASFLVEQIIFRYGTVGELVTDNGPSLDGEFTRIVNKYNIHRIKISPYNSQANGVVERGHFTIREALVKMCSNDISKWPSLLQAALYADRITVRRATGFSPYYLLHGVHPLLPCDLAEATFMVPRLRDQMSDVDLIAVRTRQLAKMPEDLARAKETLQKSRFKSKQAFEKKFRQRLQRTSFNPGELVLIRNNTNEKTVSINRKIENRYMGPYRVVRETRGKAYVLEELNGNVLRTSVAAFRLIPYVKREQLDGWARLIDVWDQDRSESSDGSESESGTGEQD